MALVIGGFVLVMVARDYDAGLDAVRRAIALNPGSGFVAMFSGAAQAFADDPEEALAHTERAMALSPAAQFDIARIPLKAIVAVANEAAARARVD
jgi:hypothetical protein